MVRDLTRSLRKTKLVHMTEARTNEDAEDDQMARRKA